MRVLVQTGSPPTTLLDVEAPTLNVGGIKEEIHRVWDFPVAQQRLVCCGQVLVDSANELPEVCMNGSEPLWMVTSPNGLGFPPAILASLFPATGAAPSNLQDQEEAAINLFGRFCLSITNPIFISGTLPPPSWPTDAERSALASAETSLNDQTVFFTPYACALLWDESNSGRASLQLICLDDHNMFVHSGTTGRAHSARVGVARVLPLGAVPIEQLDAVLQRSQQLLTDIKTECKGKDQRIGWNG